MIARYLSYPLFIVSMSLLTALILPAYLLRDLFKVIARHFWIRMPLLIACVVAAIYWARPLFQLHS